LTQYIATAAVDAIAALRQASLVCTKVNIIIRYSIWAFTIEREVTAGKSKNKSK